MRVAVCFGRNILLSIEGSVEFCIGAVFDIKTRVAVYLPNLDYRRWYSFTSLSLNSQGLSVHMYSQYIVGLITVQRATF